MHYAACLHDMHLYDDARAGFMVVHEQIPQDPMPVANIASGYVQQGKLRDAFDWASKALALNPDNTIGRIAKGYACLGLGRWREAWQYVEALYGEHVATRIYRERDNEEPEWDGSPGKTVVVTCDQGIGDIILFAQCLHEMVRDCKEVIVECPQRLVGMFRRSFPGVTVYGTLAQTNMRWVHEHQIDARINMSFLGRVYRNLDKDFPRKPYLVADHKRQQKWREWLEQYPRPWVGLAWQGGLISTQRASRSVPLAAYAEIIKAGGTCFDMSYQDQLVDIARWNIDNQEQVIRPWPDLSDYEDTIALVSVLDEVVTVTTALAHVCGALGRSASVLVPHAAQWRYQYRCGDGMIWYPENSVRLYRQLPGETDFANAIKRIVRDRKQLKKAA